MIVRLPPLLGSPMRHDGCDVMLMFLAYAVRKSSAAKHNKRVAEVHANTVREGLG